MTNESIGRASEYNPDVIFSANIENEWTYDTLKALTAVLGTTDLNFDQSYDKYGSEWTGRYHTGGCEIRIRWSAS